MPKFVLVPNPIIEFTVLCLILQGSALGSMVGFMTYGNRKYYPLDAKMRELIPPLYKAMKDLVPFVDADAAAFSEYMVRKIYSFYLKLLQKTRLFVMGCLCFIICNHDLHSRNAGVKLMSLLSLLSNLIHEPLLVKVKC